MADIHRCARADAEDGRVSIDLREMSWCEPAGLVAIAALAVQARALGHDVQIRRPANRNVANYLARMRLGTAMSTLGAQHDLPAVRERPLETRLVELMALIDEAACDDAAAHVRDTTAARCGTPVADRLYEALVEAAQNVAQHSGAPQGYVAAQAFPTKKEVRFAVADAGVGLRQSLASRGAHDDETAIQLALAGTSRFREKGRGTGFPTMAALTAVAGGRLDVVSGRARYNGRRIIGVRHGVFAGTMIQGTLRYRE